MDSEKTLSGLGHEEERLIAEVSAVEGTFEAKYAALEVRGVLRAYVDVHRGYVGLAAAGDIEALKRALFLQWFAQAEPPAFTGVANLDRVAIGRAMELIESHCAADTIDDELAWMLPYYYFIADWAFPPAAQCPQFTAFCKAHEPKGLTRPPEARQLRGRGQMGEYWSQMQRAGAK